MSYTLDPWICSCCGGDKEYGLRKHPDSTRKDPEDNPRICPACDMQEFRLDEECGAWVCDSCGHQLEQGEY